MALFECGFCGHKQDVPDEYSGRSARCPKCRETSLVTRAESQNETGLAVISPIIAEPVEDPESEVRRCSGGSIRTKLSHGIVLNKSSSLQREWITINDPALPVRLTNPTGVSTIWESGDDYSAGGYKYKATYSILTFEALAALEVRFLTFDIWGKHDKTLSATQIEDIPIGKEHEFTGEWYLGSENEASEFYASIAFIAQLSWGALNRPRGGALVPASHR